jgi:3-hydroxybutyryl-CoA dehydrogenase
MSGSEIERVGIVGGGIMGAGIAEVCLRAGLHVVLAEVDDEAGARARSRIEASLVRAVKRRKLEAAMATASLGRLECASAAELSDRQLVIEAVVEDKATKVAVFAALAEVVGDQGAILASNTSSIPIVELAAAAGVRAR